MESMVLKDKQIFAIRRILEKSSSPHHIELLGKTMKGNGEVQFRANPPIFSIPHINRPSNLFAFCWVR